MLISVRGEEIAIEIVFNFFFFAFLVNTNQAVHQMNTESALVIIGNETKQSGSTAFR